MEKICVVGLGYIGLPTAALLANRRFKVLGIDVKQEIVDIINQGKIHIVEPGLSTFVKAAVTSGNLTASLEPQKSDVFIIAVPTPFHEGHIPNLDYVIDATKKIAPFVEAGNLIILESTSPVGTTEKIKETLEAENVDCSGLHIAHCPERVLPGKVMKELIDNDRIIGGLTEEATEKVAEFYKTFVEGEVLKTDARTAELCKLVENSSRDAQIAFANELSLVCDKAGINVWELIRLANRHPRVNILNPGTGVGGHCIAVDPWFIVADFPEEAQLIRKAREINNYKTEWVIEKIKNEALQFELKYGKKPTVGALGLAFKPDIDDLRESPAVHVVNSLLKNNINVCCVEPNIETHPTFDLIALEDVEKEVDIIVYLVGHKPFIKFNSELPYLDFCGIKNK